MGLTQQVRIGCSGWQYRHWAASAKAAAGHAFYPADLPQRLWFSHYAVQFDTVEINNSFYRLPPPETFAKWRAQAPPHFLYAVKASRFLTHMKKLKDPEEPLARFFDSAKELGPHLGPVLYQLPPNWGIDVDRFEHFLASLPKGPRHVVEFRERSWYDSAIYALLTRYKVALCLHDMQGSATDKLIVGPFIYVRFHHGTARYGGRYPDASLDEWADWLADRIADGLDVFAYFNNDTGGHAPRDAVRLRDRLQMRLDAA
jgi:uncharacterized protein YecE (DUF72 family)